MSYSSKVDADFVHYLESMVNLDALDRMTENLGVELQDSQQVMNQIKGMIDSLPKNPQDSKPEPNSGFRNEDLSHILNDTMPKLLMPDMDENTCDVNLDDIIATMKSYAEDIKKNLVLTKPKTQVGEVKRELDDLDLGKYASSLEVLCKRLKNLKLNKKDEGSQRNPDLEVKLSVLCDDVNMFTQVHKYLFITSDCLQLRKSSS